MKSVQNEQFYLTLFDDAINAIMSDMSRDVLPLFVHSSYYKNALKNAK